MRLRLSQAGSQQPWSGAVAVNPAAAVVPSPHGLGVGTSGHVQRRHLQFLSDHMLRDIGLTRADVRAEASKPFWRA